MIVAIAESKIRNKLKNLPEDICWNFDQKVVKIFEEPHKHIPLSSAQVSKILIVGHKALQGSLLFVVISISPEYKIDNLPSLEEGVIGVLVVGHVLDLRKHLSLAFADRVQLPIGRSKLFQHFWTDFTT